MDPIVVIQLVVALAAAPGVYAAVYFIARKCPSEYWVLPRNWAVRILAFMTGMEIILVGSLASVGLLISLYLRTLDPDIRGVAIFLVSLWIFLLFSLFFIAENQGSKAGMERINRQGAEGEAR